MKILVTGGMGYIGSHTCVVLLQSGHEITILDNLSNSKEEVLNRIRKITEEDIKFYKADLLDRAAVRAIFKENTFEAVIHFAALKSPAESIFQPLRYYHNNVTGTLILLETMLEFNLKKLVFSSSATVYGEDNQPPLLEHMPISAINPYGRSKVMMEQAMRDLYRTDPAWDIAILRYFNPVGAHPSGLIGEDPQGIPANLLPFVAQVAVGKRSELSVFGDDYPTPDGTCIRDYIHVMDLAEGHLKALDKLASKPGLVTYNLGTGRGYSVMEVVHAFEKACGKKIPYRIAARRPGDLPISYADPGLAHKELGWRATRSLDDICADAWRWQSRNPNGYD